MSGVLPANLSAISTCVVYVDGLGEPRTCDLLDLAAALAGGARLGVRAGGGALTVAGPADDFVGSTACPTTFHCLVRMSLPLQRPR